MTKKPPIRVVIPATSGKPVGTQLEAIRKRAEKATEGPWTWTWDEDGGTLRDRNREPVLEGVGINDEYWIDAHPKDEDFIAHAREDIPVLLNEVERLREALKTVESWTRNPREYEPSYYSINHVARTALGGDTE